MITLHKLGGRKDPFQLNPDLIVTVESTPDTVVTLATAAKVLVSETPEQVTARTRAWHAEVLAEALGSRGVEADVMRLHRRVRSTADVA
jgi:flagellar protein FlbD